MRRPSSLLICAAVLGGGHASAAVHFVAQANQIDLSFLPGGSFAGCYLVGHNRLESVADAPGDQYDLQWATGSWNYSNFSVLTEGGVTVTPYSPPRMDHYWVRHATGQPGAHTFNYTKRVTGDIGLPVDYSFLYSIENGAEVLSLEYATTGLPAPGLPMHWSLTIPGDWSQFGTGPGQVEFLQLNPEWQATQFFVFDGIRTTIALERSPSAPQGSFSGLQFRLHGQPVPAPSVLALFALLGVRRGRVRRSVPCSKQPAMTR